MTIGGDTTGWLWRSLAGSTCDPVPYRHWLLDDVLRPEVAAALAMLPVAPAEIGDTEGRRETHNASRVFFDTVLQAAHPRCAEVARAFQDPATIRRLNTMCGVALDGASLRIEFCQDVEGFWLEPHTDIGVKRFTMLVYLSTGPGSEAWGTDIYDADRTRVATVPSHRRGAPVADRQLRLRRVARAARARVPRPPGDGGLTRRPETAGAAYCLGVSSASCWPRTMSSFDIRAIRPSR
jgi:hypothetical protein